MLPLALRQGVRAQSHVRPVLLSGKNGIQSRSFWNASIPQKLQGAGGVFHTKYNIVRPGREGTDWDDFLCKLPERDELASTHKEVPVFLRYLKIVTDAEGRQEHFKNFVERAKNGLQVESDVFLTTEELLAVMWKNGYTEKERSALQFVFPADYRFHYPELAVMFDLAEEDCYKFCMRSRVGKSHIGELQTDKVKRKGLIRDHWLMFGVGALIFKTFPFFNYYFVFKGFGTAMWGYTMWHLTNRWLGQVISGGEFAAEQATAKEVMDGEDKIMDAMKRFGNDARCLSSLKGFTGDVSETMKQYRKALLEQERAEIVSKASKQLQAIANFEDSVNAKLQQSLVKEVADEFKEKFASDTSMQKSAFDSALQSLKGETATNDPLVSHFETTLSSLDLSGKVKGKAGGSVSERLAYLQEQQEKEFVNTFYVTDAEVEEAKAAGDDASVFAAMRKVYGKVGFHVPQQFGEGIALAGDLGTAAADKFATEANAARDKVLAQVRQKTLDDFKASLA